MSTPTPITDWLERLGLGQYAQRFVENEITLSILPDLTDVDLKELGVSALGHRRLLLRAIAALDNVEKPTPTHSSRRPRPLPRTPRCLPRCCRFRTTDAIPRSTLPRSSVGKERMEALIVQTEALNAPNARADDLRGCTLDRPHEPRTVWSCRGSDPRASAYC